MKKSEFEKQKERAEKYCCTGRCYWDTGMCPRVDICDETRTTEFAAALIGLISVPALIFIGIGVLYWIATTM